MAPILDSLYEQELMTVFQDHGFVMDILLSYGPLGTIELASHIAAVGYVLPVEDIDQSLEKLIEWDLVFLEDSTYRLTESGTALISEIV